MEGEDRIWIGNYAHYNEGSLVGDWLELPFEPAALGGWLEEHAGVDEQHEEVGVFDSDLCGRLGYLGIEVPEATDIPALNGLAAAAQLSTVAELDAAAAYISCTGTGRGDPVAAANVLLQADDIPVVRLMGERFSFKSDAERLAMSVVDDPADLPDEELEAHFDHQRYGKDRNLEDVCLGDDSFAYHYSYDDVDPAMYEPCELPEEAERLGVAVTDLPDLDRARDLLRFMDVGSSAIDRDAAEDPVAVRAAAGILGRLSGAELDEFRIYQNYVASADAGPNELASAALQCEGGRVTPLPCKSRDTYEDLGMALEDEEGVSREDRARYFDWESYGLDLEDDYIIQGDLAICAYDCDVDLEEYSRADIVAYAEPVRAEAPTAMRPIGM